MTPPFYAETASTKGNESWPYWIVRNIYCNSLGLFYSKGQAVRLASAMNKMGELMNGAAETQVDGEEYYMLPEEALQYLPEEWRKHFQAMADDGRVVLKSVDNELSQLVRLLSSFTSVVTLKHIQKRLSEYKFEPAMDAFLELEMLTTAFVVTYARVHHGGVGIGFSRNSLPETQRSFHDQILEMRNKRFAHHDEHHSVTNALEVSFGGDRFELKFGVSLGFHIGGRNEWPELVKTVEALYFEKIEKLLVGLKKKTGYEWALPTGPAPE